MTDFKALSAKECAERLLEIENPLILGPMAGVTDMADAVIEVSPEVAALILKAKIALSSDNGEALEAGCLGSIGRQVDCRHQCQNHANTQRPAQKPFQGIASSFHRYTSMYKIHLQYTLYAEKSQ